MRAAMKRRLPNLAAREPANGATTIVGNGQVLENGPPGWVGQELQGSCVSHD